MVVMVSWLNKIKYKSGKRNHKSKIMIVIVIWGHCCLCHVPLYLRFYLTTIHTCKYRLWRQLHINVNYQQMKDTMLFKVKFERERYLLLCRIQNHTREYVSITYSLVWFWIRLFYYVLFYYLCYLWKYFTI